MVYRSTDLGSTRQAAEEAITVMTRSEILRQRQAMRQRIRATVYARRMALAQPNTDSEQLDEAAAR